MKKQRIAFCLRDMQMGGVESVLIRTLDELLKHKNIELNLVTYVDIKTPIYKQYFEQHKNIKIISLYPCSWLGTKLPHFFLTRIVLHFMRDIYRSFNRIFVMAKLKNIDVFIDYHDFGFYNELRNIKNAKKIAWFHSSIDVFVKRCFINKVNIYDNVVVLTDACKNDLQKLYPQITDKIIRIYNPIDIKDIQNKSKEEKHIKDKYFCCVSRLSKDKDIKTILNAFEDFYMINNKPEIKMVFVGDGDRADEYKKYAKSLKSSKQIVFVGMQKNPFVYMKNALVNVLSSYGEGLPTVLIESAAVDTLNIASDCKYGPREILLNGDGGLLFEPGNVEQLAKGFDDVYNKKIDIKAMIKQSNRALTRFDAKEIVNQIISLIS